MSLHLFTHFYLKVGMIFTLVFPALVFATSHSADSKTVSPPQKKLQGDLTVIAEKQPQLDGKPGPKRELGSRNMADALRLVRQMQQAYQQGNFEIIALKLGEGRLEPFRITHSVLPLNAALQADSNIVDSRVGRSVEHHIYLNGPVYEALKIDGQLRFFEQGQAPLVLSAEQLPGLLPSLVHIDLQQLSQSYRLVLAGRDRMAGRIARLVRVIPKDPSLYSMQLWIDLATQLPLRVDLLNQQEQLIGQLMVVSLRPLPQAPAWLEQLSNSEPTMQGLDSRAVPSVPTKQEYPVNWDVSWLPLGMKPVYADSHALAITQTLVAYKKYSNGLVDVSVYVSKAQKAPPVRLQRVMHGPVSLYSVVMGEFEVTVVGELPLETAQRVAESVIITTASQD